MYVINPLPFNFKLFNTIMYIETFTINVETLDGKGIVLIICQLFYIYIYIYIYIYENKLDSNY